MYEKKKLGEICIIGPQKNQVKDFAGNVSFVPMKDINEKQKFFEAKEIKNISEVYKGYTYFENNDVLLAKVTPCFENGKSGIAKNLENGIGFGSSEFYVFRSLGKILPEFLYYRFTCSDFLKLGKENMSGAVGLQRVTKKFIENFQIPLPPLPTQQKIVEKLDNSFEKIEKNIEYTKRNLVNIEEQNKSILEKIFRECEEEFEMKKLGEISKNIQYGYTGKTIEDGKIKYLRITDIQDNNIIWEKVPFVEIPEKEIEKYSLNEGDIVFARTGATVGKSCLIDKKGVGNVFASYLIRVIPDKNIIKPLFFKYFFLSGAYWQQILSEVVGSAQPNFNGTKLKSIQIPLPPLSKQQEIVNYLDNIFTKNSELKNFYEKNLKNLEELKQSILKKAFEDEEFIEENI